MVDLAELAVKNPSDLVEGMVVLVEAGQLEFRPELLVDLDYFDFRPQNQHIILV